MVIRQQINLEFLGGNERSKYRIGETNEEGESIRQGRLVRRRTLLTDWSSAKGKRGRGITCLGIERNMHVYCRLHSLYLAGILAWRVLIALLTQDANMCSSLRTSGQTILPIIGRRLSVRIGKIDKM
nr:hypothetical protein Iba_chr11cCG4150 [Ipomoea batatas]